jgi:hypothetical protein
MISSNRAGGESTVPIMKQPREKTGGKKEGVWMISKWQLQQEE